MTFSKSILKKITTSETTRPNFPQITIENPLDDDTIINGIELILSAEFSKKGRIRIEINDVPIFDETDSAQFEGYGKYPIPLGKTLRRSETVKIWGWNGDDSNTLEVSANMSISKIPEQFNSQAVPLGKDVFNQVVSESEEIFPFAVYSGVPKTALIDLQGYKKFIVTMSASTIPTITEEQALDQSQQGTVEDVFFDFTQTTGSTTLAVSGYEETDDYDVSQIIDLGSTRDRSLTFDEDKQNGFVVGSKLWNTAGTDSLSDGSHKRAEIQTVKTQTYDVYESDDPTFVSDVTTLETAVSSVSEPLITTKRYVKIVEHISVSFDHVDIDLGSENNIGGSQPDVTLDFDYYKLPTLFTNWLDTLSQGGTAALSFEILGSGNQWIELISSSEFGTITSGNTVIRQIGDVVSQTGADKVGFVLPSTQTAFRAKLTLTNAIETGVSILKVA